MLVAKALSPLPSAAARLAKLVPVSGVNVVLENRGLRLAKKLKVLEYTLSAFA